MGTVVFISYYIKIAVAFSVAIVLAALCVYVFGKIVGVF